MLAFKGLVRSESGYQWGIDKPEDVWSYDFWEVCKTNGLG